MLLKCVPRVQHDYFSSFNQSDHCLLVLSLLLPSSLLKLPIDFKFREHFVFNFTSHMLNMKNSGVVFTNLILASVHYSQFNITSSLSSRHFNRGVPALFRKLISIGLLLTYLLVYI